MSLMSTLCSIRQPQLQRLGHDGLLRDSLLSVAGLMAVEEGPFLIFFILHPEAVFPTQFQQVWVGLISSGTPH